MQRTPKTLAFSRISRRSGSWTQWFDKRVSGWGCALGWFAATAVFTAFTRLFGGPTQSDTSQSIYATWAIAHGVPACAYPATPQFSGIAPLYPLVSGGLSALLGIGHRVPFPTRAALGPHCGTALAVMSAWYARSGAVVPTILIGYVGWLALLAGLIALLRTTSRGGRRWEPAVLIVVASLPPVFMPLQEFFHPEDLMAMGLALGGLACVRRGCWLWAGVLLGLAIVSQQFTLLILAPLVVIAPRGRRVRFVGASVGAVVGVVVPLIGITSGGVIRAMIGTAATPSSGRTVLAEMHLHGLVLLVVSRVLPIALAMTLAWWTARRFGPNPLEPLVLVSLITVSLTLRLVFEVNLYGYYFMAAAVSLVVLDALRGRVRVTLVAWSVAVSLAFMPLPWGYDPWGNGLPIWLWQILLVPPAVALALGPILATTYDRSNSKTRIRRSDLLGADETLRESRVPSGWFQSIGSGM